MAQAPSVNPPRRVPPRRGRGRRRRAAYFPLNLSGTMSLNSRANDYDFLQGR
jgi:hypothetical protein